MSDYHIHTKPRGVRLAGDRAIRRLLPIASKLKYLIVTGQSGIVPGSIAAYTLGLSLAIIRKFGEDSHGTPIEATARFMGLRQTKPEKLALKCCILDDFISSGNTLRTIEAAIGFRPHFVAFYSRWEQAGRVKSAQSHAPLPLTKLSFNIFRWEQPPEPKEPA